MMSRLRKLDDYVTFYEISSDSPEPGWEEETEVFKSFCEIYEPSAKDVQLGNLETSKTNTTLIIRNPMPEYIPRVSHTFTINSGLYKGISFNIKNIAPDKQPNYLKLVGEAQ